MINSTIIYGSIHDFEKHVNSSWSKVFILVDENTNEHCLPRLFENLDFFAEAEILLVDAGEESKSIEIAYQLWGGLLDAGADRKSLLVNLGGGMITDLGGFVASNFKRGIDFIHIPTTLVGQVDAAIGGKTGVNFEGVKNQIGTFASPQYIYLDKDFLQTLPKREYISGIGEVIKYGLIKEAKILELLEGDKTEIDFNQIIQRCVEIKKEIIEFDPYEKGERKKLNFGHTVGHAIETFKQGDLLHGEAIAYGMIIESHISLQKALISQGEFDKIIQTIEKFFNPVKISSNHFEQLHGLMLLDKKNNREEINFTLLTGIGTSEVNHVATKEEILKALDYYFA